MELSRFVTHVTLLGNSDAKRETVLQPHNVTLCHAVREACSQTSATEMCRHRIMSRLLATEMFQVRGTPGGLGMLKSIGLSPPARDEKFTIGFFF